MELPAGIRDWSSCDERKQISYSTVQRPTNRFHSPGHQSHKFVTWENSSTFAELVSLGILKLPLVFANDGEKSSLLSWTGGERKVSRDFQKFTLIFEKLTGGCEVHCYVLCGRWCFGVSISVSAFQFSALTNLNAEFRDRNKLSYLTGHVER